jgi:hypothetical protein
VSALAWDQWERDHQYADWGYEYETPDDPPTLPESPVCVCGCSEECHDLIGPTTECLECDECPRFREVKS